jgi:hypothetical protein
MNTYRKIATVKAKLFEKGDEDGMIAKGDILDVMEDNHYNIKTDLVPFIKTLENQYHKGEFNKYYLCIGIDNERWLVEKSIFERTYELVNS